MYFSHLYAYRARYLSLMVVGENHPHIALLDSNIGLILHAVAEYELSLKFLEKALELSKKYFGARSLKTAVGHHLVARTQSCIGRSNSDSSNTYFHDLQLVYTNLVGIVIR